jgi:Na+/H+ antiporter NhaD/arsenite permease-like protein
MAPNPWMMLPFALLLGSIALGPWLAPKFWARHDAKVALGLGAIVAVYYLFVLHKEPYVERIAYDYISFIALIGSLFVVSGGIHIIVQGEATPRANVVFLFIGAILANFFGTTGAAMLLIQPWIRTNESRIAAHHLVFFIFIVANVGGCLSAVGDPPLFVGYLQGVPFWWITRNTWPAWLVGVGMLLAIFYIIDRRHYLRALGEAREKKSAHETWKFAGGHNLVFLAVILAAATLKRPIFLREAVMIAAAVASYFTTRRSIHAANNFTFHPVREVAVLFAGIFATMIPALDWLELNAGPWLGPNPARDIFFWGTGSISSVLDNAPTYLAFLSALSGATGSDNVARVVESHPAQMLAISIGAVFFGGTTYLGNGPNFLVKSIADRRKIPMPTFPGFILKYTVPYFLPMLIVVWLLFFRG